MATMNLELAAAAVGNLAPKLLQLLTVEYDLGKGLKKQVRFLSDELQSVHDDLCKVAKVHWDQLDEQDKNWARELREACYDMEDVVDTFLVRVDDHRDTGLLKRALKKMSQRVKARRGGIFKNPLPRFADIMKQILEDLVNTEGRHEIGEIIEPPRHSTVYTRASPLVGMDGPRQALLKMLLLGEDDWSSKGTKIISIVGFGGLGKTTVAKAVYDMVIHQFDCGAFVPVGRNPDPKEVLTNILVHVTHNGYEESAYLNQFDVSVVIDRLRDSLQDKRYFIVVDDIWDLRLWNIIRVALTDSGGSRIITTTRILDVAVKASMVYKLQPLSYENSKYLFSARIFRDHRKNDKLDEELDEVSDKILKKCDGIPLAIIIMAGFFVGKPREMWSELYKAIDFGHKDDMQVTRRILSFCYYDMPLHLKLCFLYLSMFPEDCVIEKDNLIWRWIAEGFVQIKQGKWSYEVGEEYFNDLINRSMIQAVQSEFDGVVQGCRVHDIVRDLICSLSHEENFASVLINSGERHILTHIRRLAIQNSKEECTIDGMDLPRLRSLSATGCPMYTISPSDSFKLLRVLSLENCGSLTGRYHLEFLGKLCNLRFLGLRNTFIGKLPDEIGDLKLMQTLELERTGVKNLPETMRGLTALSCLKSDRNTRVPVWIGRLTSLQQLEIFSDVGADEDLKRWFAKEERNLSELRVIRLFIEGQDNKGQLRDLLESLFHLPKIVELHVHYYGARFSRGVKLEPECSILSENLRILELFRLEFSRLPVWINPRDLPNLCKLCLTLSDLDEQDLKILGGFPELIYLHMLIVNTRGGDIVTSGSGAFRNLKSCRITKPLNFVPGAMPSLEALYFHFNVRLLRDADYDFDFGFGLENLPSLRQVIVKINCLAALPEEVEEAKEALRHKIDIHPYSPTLEMETLNEEEEQTIDDDAETERISNSANESGVEVLQTEGNQTEELEKTSMDLETEASVSPLDQTKVVAEGDGESAFYAKSSVPQHDDIDEKVDEVIKILYMAVVDNEADNKKTKILSIVRYEETGKTNIAQKAFEKLKPQFDCGAFVLVGQNPDFRKVFTDILVGLDKHKYKNLPMKTLDSMELTGLVRKSLVSKRFFVVFDDIWDMQAWKIIKDALVENSNGSAVLTTSRNADITKDIGGSKQFLPLSTTDSTKLFGPEYKCPPETCGGEPSVINETVTLLASIPASVEVSQAVSDSYANLPVHLKNCLLYFSMFPKGYETSRESLVCAWMAEDFLQDTQGRQFWQEIGESYLSDLIKEKMIEAVEVDADGKALLCRAYDLVHDFIISKSTEANFVAILNGSQDSPMLETVEHLSLQGNTELPSRWKGVFPQVKSLTVSCDTMPPLSRFPGLRVMDLGGCDSLQEGHLKDIKKTAFLKYLVIGGKCITGILENIAKLKQLQTLDLSGSSLNELPECVLSLRKLERLCVNSHMKIPGWIAKMSALQELGDINIIEPELLKKLRKLSKLRVLRIAIWSWDDSLKTSVKQMSDNLRSLLQSTENIQSLSILTCCSLDFMDGLGDKWAPQSLNKLEIRYRAFDTLQSWFDSLSSISSLTIEVYQLSEDIISTLGKLPTLCSLSLTSKQEPAGFFFIDSDRFKNLASLKFVSNAMLEMFARPQSIPTQQLKRLTIVFEALRTENINKDFIFGLENLCSLEHVRVEIICFNASHQMVSNAEAAIREAISRDRSSQPSLEIRRLEEESMIAEEVLHESEKNAQNRGKKDQCNEGSPASMDFLNTAHISKTLDYSDATQEVIHDMGTTVDESPKECEERSSLSVDELVGVPSKDIRSCNYLESSGVYLVRSSEPNTKSFRAHIRELEQIVQEQTLQIKNARRKEQELHATISSQQKEIMDLKRQVEEARVKQEKRGGAGNFQEEGGKNN